MIRKDKKYDPDTILNLVRNIPKCHTVKHNFDGDNIKFSSHRLRVFSKSKSCVYCNIVGKYFYKEKDTKSISYHFNLYAIDSEQNEVLMTKDHIIPRSKGGKDIMENYQTCCFTCNQKKDTTTHEDFLKQMDKK